MKNNIKRICISDIKSDNEYNFEILRKNLLGVFKNYIHSINNTRVTGFKPLKSLSIKVHFDDKCMNIEAKGLDYYLYALESFIKEQLDRGIISNYKITDLSKKERELTNIEYARIRAISDYLDGRIDIHGNRKTDVHGNKIK